MGQNKDEIVRKLVETREITPSADSWNKLEMMLDANEKKTPNSKMWLFIAAAVFGALLLSTTFFFKSENQSEQIQVVESTEQPSIKEVDKFELPSQSVNESVAQTSIVEKASAEKNSPKKQVAKIQQNHTESLLAEVQPKQSLAVKSHIVLPTVTNENVSELLAQSMNHQKDNASIKVNAKSLLAEVDTEIELTFREKVIKSATKNFQNIKVAVVNRNLE